MKRPVLSFLSIIFLLALCWLLRWEVRDSCYEFAFDLFQDNPYVDNRDQIDQILGKFNKISFNKIPKSHRQQMRMDYPTYRTIYQEATFYEVPPQMLYQYIVGYTRIRDVVSRDNSYADAIIDRSLPIYWCIDKHILYQLLALQDALTEAGYERDEFWVNSGFRTPIYNKEVGGASKSRHMHGQALDLHIEDINCDGSYTNVDKQIVLDLLETKIIGDNGGIGRYPGSRAVHMDVRGYRARWDSY